MLVFLVVLVVWAAIEFGLGRRTKGEYVAKSPLWSEALVIGLTGLSIVTALILSTAVPAAVIHPESAPFALGLSAIVIGVTVRLVAASTLGAYYTLTLAIQAGQTVCSSGPYRWVRHPGYTGTVLAIIGLGCAFGNWYSIAATALVVPVFVTRAVTEERMITTALGAEYCSYTSRVRRRFVPWLV
jgi:protein-S-isoprenylcysteine O-methyltransferase Ste14